MCGIVGAVAQRDVTPILLEGLRRLEYRGYDSAGIAVLNADHLLERTRVAGKIEDLERALQGDQLSGKQELPIHVGQRMENLQSRMPILIYVAISLH